MVNASFSAIGRAGKQNSEREPLAAIALLCLLVIAHAALGGEEDLPNATLDVYNPNYPESKFLAEYYAERRAVQKTGSPPCPAPTTKKSTGMSTIAKSPS